MRAIFFAASLAFATLAAAQAQDGRTSQPAGPSVGKSETSTSRDRLLTTDEAYAKAKAIADAEERSWERKMKRSMRSICTGC